MFFNYVISKWKNLDLLDWTECSRVLWHLYCEHVCHVSAHHTFLLLTHFIFVYQLWRIHNKTTTFGVPSCSLCCLEATQTWITLSNTFCLWKIKKRYKYHLMCVQFKYTKPIKILVSDHLVCPHSDHVFYLHGEQACEVDLGDRFGSLPTLLPHTTSPVLGQLRLLAGFYQMPQSHASFFPIIQHRGLW